MEAKKYIHQPPAPKTQQKSNYQRIAFKTQTFIFTRFFLFFFFLFRNALNTVKNYGRNPQDVPLHCLKALSIHKHLRHIVIKTLHLVHVDIPSLVILSQ